MKYRKSFAYVLLCAFFANLLALPIQAQNQTTKGKPVNITFGQPNIWSLEQAHYLLAQMRERSLSIKATNLADLNPNSAEASRINLIRQILGISGTYQQLPSYPTPDSTPTPTPTPVPSPVALPSPIPSPSNQLSNSVIEKFLQNPEFVKMLFSNPKLNATTQLDNHIQLQYEIIAKQLTLLRDEVGPDERIVFLELPQSVYASSGNADNKVVRSYWEVEGYGVLDKENYIKKESAKIQNKITDLNKIKDNKPKRNPTELDELDELWERTLENDIQNNITRLKQTGSRPLKEIMEETSAAVKNSDKKSGSTEYVSVNPYSLKAIELIPRQSAINVTDVQEKVKSTFLSGALSFLFGLGIRGQYERQSDLFEQYLHQELYSAGFGKDSNLFGWTFGPVPGTKRVAPGMRVTYAVLKVPKEAESVVINARGCYFPRNDYEPPNGISESSSNTKWWSEGKRECFNKQQFILPVPNGGGTAGFWLTGVDYTPVETKGGRVVASIYGQNFTSQVGVLINGVPLQQVVELTRKLTDTTLVQARCQNIICGEYEVIDSNEITMVFIMPEDYKGTPNISVIGPGRSVGLNDLNRIKIRANGQKFNFTGHTDNTNCQEKTPNGLQRTPCNLKSGEVPFMFGARNKNELAIGDLKILGVGGGYVTALLSGTKLSDSDEIYVNGSQVNRLAPKSETFCKVEFPLPTNDSVTIVIKNGVKSDVKTFTLPLSSSTQFRITKVTPLSYDKDKQEMFVRIEGNGLANISLIKVNNDLPHKDSAIIPVSPSEVLVKITQPATVLRITLRGQDGTEINAVFARP